MKIELASSVSRSPRLGLDEARMRIAKMYASDGESLRDIWSELSAVAMEAMGVDRVGVWVVVDEGEAVRCRYLSQRSNKQLFQGTVLRARDFPNYFRALEEHRVVVADDARTSPQTAELCEAYLEPLAIASMLDAPLYEAGRITGVVCHEHIGAPRKWTEAECDFAMAVADNISRLYQEHLRRGAETSMRAFETHLAELRRMEAIGRMAACIAHDFRGVLSVVSGFTELSLRVAELPSDADRYLRQIQKAAEKGYQLIKEVTDFGKEEAVSPRVFDVRKVVQALAPMFRVLVSEKIDCHIDTEQAVSRVFMDPSQLERALLNLVINARDAMPDGGRLTIRVAESAIDGEDGEPETYVALTVSDTGVGMDDDTCRQILKPFFTTKGDRGTGLGLAIVNQVVSRAGGIVRFDSALGRGTAATLYLPRIAAPVAV